jgi:hypothetical protein
MRDIDLNTYLRRALSLAATAIAAYGTAAVAEPLEDFIEINYQDPLTAVPPVRRPETRSCAIRLMDHAFATSFGLPFVGDFTPPADCPGPWSKVVMDWNGSVMGVQFDRLAGVWIGGAEMLRTITPEPDPTGIHWHVEKDVSEYAPLLAAPQTVVVDLGNIVDGPYTGIFFVTLDLTFYSVDEDNPPAPHSDLVVPVSNRTDGAAWTFLHNSSQAAAKNITFPPNLTRALFEVYASAHGPTEEFWYVNDTAGAYREIQVFVDDALAGVIPPFPVVYTGGIDFLFWRPIPGVDAFNIPPYVFDLTPFAGTLTDGQPHNIAIKVYGNAGRDDNDVWPVDGVLLLDVDPRAASTDGGVLQNTFQPLADISVDNVVIDGIRHITTQGLRSGTVEGYVNTSAGRIVTRVDQDIVQATERLGSTTMLAVSQSQRSATTTTVTNGRHRPRVTRQDDDYPLAVGIQVSNGVLPDGHTSQIQRSSVDNGRNRTVVISGRHDDDDQRVTTVSDHVTGQAVLVRDITAVPARTVGHDGIDSEDYVFRTRDRCYIHSIAAKHGYVTDDNVQTHCREHDDD